MNGIRYELIKARGKENQSKIASYCGVTQQTYSHWERGKSNPSIKHILMLEQLFNVPKEVLFSDLFYLKNRYLEKATGTE